MNNSDLARDEHGMFRLIAGFPAQCREAVRISDECRLPGGYSDVDNIVIAGMGGSAIAGDLLLNCLSERMNIPVVVSRDYGVPGFTGEKTLFAAVSYSGNTEETLSSAREAAGRSAKIFAITSGGELESFCADNGFPVVKIPSGMPPRTAAGYLSFPLLLQAEKTGLAEKAREDIEETLNVLESFKRRVLSGDNPAEGTARRLFGKLPVIYGSSRNTFSAVLRWRTQLNENSKTLASTALFPEMNHNEIVGWEKPEQIIKNCRVVVLRDAKDADRVKKRIEITGALIKDACAGIEEVFSEGESPAARVFSLIYYGDFVSFYLAVLNSVDPTPVKRIDILKERMRKR